MSSEEGFTKLYGAALLNSSLWLESAEVLKVFVGMMALGNERGIVPITSIKVLANRMNLSMEETEKALAILEAPDPDSRDPDEDGRRIVREQGHWRIVNHKKFRDFRTKKQEQNRQRQERFQERKKAEAAALGSVIPNAPNADTTPTNEQKTEVSVSVSVSENSGSSLLSESATTVPANDTETPTGAVHKHEVILAFGTAFDAGEMPKLYGRKELAAIEHCRAIAKRYGKPLYEVAMAVCKAAVPRRQGLGLHGRQGRPLRAQGADHRRSPGTRRPRPRRACGSHHGQGFPGRGAVRAAARANREMSMATMADLKLRDEELARAREQLGHREAPAAKPDFLAMVSDLPG